MKRWNSIWLLCFILLVSCEDNNEIENIQPEFILAGVDSDKLDTKLYSPELQIIFKNVTAGEHPTKSYSGALAIDLNSDNINDIKFYAYYGYGCPIGFGECMPEACELRALDNKVIEIYTTPLELKDTISNKLTWNKLGPYSEQGKFIVVSPVILSSYSIDLINSDEFKNNVWISENSYLAIRIKNGNIYKYG